MDDDSRSYSNTSCTTTITGLERFAELSMLQKDSILVRHSKEAAALPSTETKRAWIQAKLNALFGIDLKNNLLSHRVSIGDAIASCQAEITGTIFPKYAAYLHVHIVQSIKTCISYTRSVVFRLPINDRDREPKLIPFFQVDDETGIVSDGLKRMIAMFNVGWLPILKALYSITKWDHAIVVNSYFGVSQDTYRYKLFITSTYLNEENESFSTCRRKKIIITSQITADSQLLFTIMTDKDKHKKKYYIQTSDQIDALIRLLKTHYHCKIVRFLNECFSSYNLQLITPR